MRLGLYLNRVDILNVVLFGKAVKQWREENVDKLGNIRDYATINEILVLANLENYNVVLMNQGKSQKE